MSTAASLHIGIAAPVATEYVAEYLDTGGAGLPGGYEGAPLTGVLVGELLRRGHRVSVFTTDAGLPPGTPPVIAHGERLAVHYCPARRRAWRFNGRYPGRAVDGFAVERKCLAEAIRRARPDLVHAHWTYEFALAALDTGLPHLVTCHDDPWVILRFTRSPYRAVRYFMARRVFRRARAFTTVSAYMADALRDRVGAPLDIVPNPLATHVLAAGRMRAAPAARRVAMIGNGWGNRKNPQPALRAFARFRAHHAEAELHCFGHDFGAGETAQHWARQQGLAAGVHFHGATPHRQMIRALDACDLLLHPALEESFGVVIAEAMALGLPVVAGAASGAVPWVAGQGALPEPLPVVLTDVGSVDALDRALEDAFGANYGARSAAGYRRARAAFSPAAVSQAYLDLYRAVLQPARHARQTAAAAPLHAAMPEGSK